MKQISLIKNTNKQKNSFDFSTSNANNDARLINGSIVRRKIMPFFLFGLIFLLCQNSYSQVNYGVNILAGKSNLIETKTPHTANPYHYNPLSSWGIGTFANYKLKELPFSIGSEVCFRRLGTFWESYTPDDENYKYWDYPFYALSIPVNFTYHYISWLSVYGGMSLSYNIISKSIKYYDYTTFYPFNWGYNVGLDVTIKNRFILGGYFYQSLNYSMKFSFDFYKPVNYGLKVGYIINK